MSEQDSPYPVRCIDCVPFRELTGRVERVEGKLDGVEIKVDGVAAEVRDLSTEFKLFKPVAGDVQRVIKFLYGNGKIEDGFAHRFFSVEEKMEGYNRLKWILIGILVAGGIGTLGALVLDAAGRGVI